MRTRGARPVGPVHYADFGGDGPPLVLVHGLGGSHVNWLAVGSRLARHGRVLAPDLVGHGRTPAGVRTAHLDVNRALLARFLAEVAGGPATLVGNSMGGLLAIEIAAAQPERVRGLVLVDAAVPPPLRPQDPRFPALFAATALPWLGEAVMLARARAAPEEGVRGMLALCCVDPGRIAPELVEAHVALARWRKAAQPVFGRDFLAAQRSLLAALLRRGRFLERVRAVRAPALVVHGDRDRLVPVASARALAAARPDWRLTVLADLGHVPQLEAPEAFLGAVEPWLAALGAGAGAAPARD